MSATTPPDDRGVVRRSIITQLVLAVLLAGLAVSRAAHGVIDPVDLVLIVTGACIVSATLGFVNGAFEARAGTVPTATAPTATTQTGAVDAGTDAFAGRRLWSRATAVTAIAGAWTAAGAITLAAVVGDQSVSFPAVAAALALLAGGAALGVDLAGRRVASRPGPVTPVSLHRRAWREIALPVAVTQVVGQGVISWVLFHDAGRAGAPELTEDAVLADALIVVTILTALIGGMATNWGRVDAAAGRVTSPDRGGRPVGGQALVLLAVAAVAMAGPAGWLVPTDPGLVHTVAVRAGLAGVLAFVAAGLGHVRGVVSASAEAATVRSDTAAVRPDDAATRRGSRGTASGGTASGASTSPRRRRAARAATAGVSLMVVAVPALSSAAPLDDLKLLAEGESFAVRVEYDIPLPADSGSIPHVKGEIRRSVAETAQGLAAAPSNFAAVVGGTLANPREDVDGEESRLPVVECVAPGDQTDVAFAYPTDIRTDTTGVPATSYATARCATGPVVELHARSVASDAKGQPTAAALDVASAATGAADLLARPIDGRLEVDTAARAEDVSILAGLVTVEEVRTSGATSLDGTVANATTDARVDLIGVNVAGNRFDLVDGEVVPSDALAPATDALGAAGCTLAVIGRTERYPQGFLLGRKDPFVGMADDGRSAGSMAGGLLIVCDMPQELSEPTTFSPQRAQIVLGFAMTSASVRDEPGGFGLDDLVTPPADTDDLVSAPAVPSVPGGDDTIPNATVDGDDTAAPAVTDPVEAGFEETVEEIVRTIRSANPFDNSPAIWLVAFAAWAALGQWCLRALGLTGSISREGER